MAKSPLQIVKEKFGEKAKLIEAVKAFMTEDLWVNRVNQAKGLEHVSNTKLLKLFNTFTAVKSEFGSRAKLIDAILELQNASKDQGLRTKLGGYPVPRLYDLYKSSKKQAKSAAPATPAA